MEIIKRKTFGFKQKNRYLSENYGDLSEKIDKAKRNLAFSKPGSFL
ncbi:hypothetical protein J2S21_001723 [Peribacillus cavernae]|nr:hypothetical protein [Peribacillus cavernae]